MKLILLYLALVNLLGLFLFARDKHLAKIHAWRIPERVLFLIALAGGSAGALAGMYLFRHKTKHPRFVFGIPAILLLQLLAVFFFLAFEKGLCR
ncbi:MAG: DUF1294 domain-containing protein [Lachnospiraceae bacterium]|nr:DUF1294 domain-containing protein [Lachnospiraceae bacterium]